MSNLAKIALFRGLGRCKSLGRTSPASCQYCTKPSDVVTHTGQKFDADDYRMARFVDKKKLVNKNFAVDLIAKVPPTKAKDRVVWCDGGSGPEGHPRVYINLDKPGNHTCGYCGLRFTKEGHH